VRLLPNLSAAEISGGGVLLVPESGLITEKLG